MIDNQPVVEVLKKIEKNASLLLNNINEQFPNRKLSTNDSPSQLAESFSTHPISHLSNQSDRDSSGKSI